MTRRKRQLEGLVRQIQEELGVTRKEAWRIATEEEHP